MVAASATSARMASGAIIRAPMLWRNDARYSRRATRVLAIQIPVSARLA
jgi:hypothetical protein